MTYLPAMQNYLNLPLLTEEEEMDLFDRYKLKNDLEAAEKLVLHHLRLVAKVARKYSGYGFPYEDLFQEGAIGLMKAIKKFDPSEGLRLFQYAYLWIKDAIGNFVIKNWKLVKLPGGKPMRKLFWNRSVVNNNSVEDASDILGVDVGRYDDLMTQERSIHQQHEEDMQAPERWLECPEPTPEAALLAFDGVPLHTHLGQLDSRRRYIIESRYMNEASKTLGDLAEELGVSKERVRQLEVDGLKKLKESLTASGYDSRM